MSSNEITYVRILVWQIIAVVLFLPLSVSAQDYLGYGSSGRPFNLTGSVSYGYAFTSSGETKRELNNVIVQVAGNSPIWQPWFATMSAGLGLGLSTSDNTTGSESDSNSSSIDFTFVLFPISRFPFRLSYSRSENEVNALNLANAGTAAAEFSTETTSQVISLQQTYTSRDNINYNFWYTNSQVDSDISGEFATSVLGFKINHTRPYHRFDVNGNITSNEQKNPNFETRNMTVSTSHGYYPSQTFGVTSLVSLSNSESDSSSDTSDIENNVAQVSSNFSWRPEHKPYTLTGGIRFAQVENQNVVSEGTETSNVNTGVTAAYRFSRHSRGTLSANVGMTESGGQQTIIASENLSLSYSSDSYVIGGFFYSWSSGFGASNSSSRVEGVTSTGEDLKAETQSGSASLGHSLGRNWLFDSGNISMGMAQNVSVSQTFGDDVAALEADPNAPPADPATLEDDPEELSKSLNQSFTVGSNHYGWGGATIFNLSLSDTRTFNEQEIEFQVLTAQLSRQQGINRLSSATGAVYFQGSRTVDPNNIAIATGEEDEVQKSASVNFTYQHGRVFGVYGLRYKTTLEQTSIIESGETEKGNLEWNNEFDYRIGLLSARLSVRLIQTPGGEETLNMFFQATRTF